MSDDTKVFLPAVISDEFGVSRSEAKRAVAEGDVSINGRMVTEMDVDLAAIAPGEPLVIELGRGTERRSDSIGREAGGQRSGAAAA